MSWGLIRGLSQSSALLFRGRPLPAGGARPTPPRAPGRRSRTARHSPQLLKEPAVHAAGRYLQPHEREMAYCRVASAPRFRSLPAHAPPAADVHAFGAIEQMVVEPPQVVPGSRSEVDRKAHGPRPISLAEPRPADSFVWPRACRAIRRSPRRRTRDPAAAIRLPRGLAAGVELGLCAAVLHRVRTVVSTKHERVSPARSNVHDTGVLAQRIGDIAVSKGAITADANLRSCR